MGLVSSMGMPILANVARVGYIGFVMLMRLRFPELLTAHSMTAYEVAKRSDGRISRSWAYRTKKLRGKLGTFGAVELEALCDVFGVEPVELWERDKKRR
jgi:hypothetical protein